MGLPPGGTKRLLPGISGGALNSSRKRGVTVSGEVQVCSIVVSPQSTLSIPWTAVTKIILLVEECVRW